MIKKTALITGATAGIGLATAQRLAKEGYRIIINGRRLDRLQQIKKQLDETGAETLISAFDVRENDEVVHAIEDLPQEWKQIDVLINNAGLGQSFTSLEKGLEEDWDRMIDTNFKGLLHVSRAVMPQMVERKSGHIINIGSTAAKQVKADTNVYSATKYAVDALTKAMRTDLLEHGIKVTAINPGIVATEFALVKAKGNHHEAKDAYTKLTPLYPEDVADAIVFVLSRPAHVNINDMLLTTQVEADLNNRLDKIIV